MFFSYFICGLIPLFPYILFAPFTALWVSLAFTLITLFLLGFVSAAMLKTKLLHSAIRMLLMGGIAVLIGIGVGIFFKGV